MVDYKDIFKIYLDFCPYYRRRLYTLTEIYNWLKSANLIPPYFPRNDKDSFFVFLDFLYHKNIVIPFFSKGLLSTSFIHFIGKERWRQDFKNGYIRFWDDDDLREKGLTYPYTFNGLEEKKIDLYFYHPLQVIQIMSFLVSLMKRCYRLFQFEDFYEFYKERMIEIKNDAYSYVKKNRFYPISLEKSLNMVKWLKAEWLKLYIKIEKINHTNLFASRHINGCEIFLVDDYHEYEEGDDPSNVESWFRNFKVEKKTYFSDTELHNLDHFAQYMKDISYRCDGLNHWSDLLCLIMRNKEKLKSIVLYDINIVQIANDLNRLSWYLKTEDIENAEDIPPDFFKNYSETETYYQKVLYKYNLTPEPLFVVYVEGPTEVNILKKWYRLRGYYHSFGFRKLRSKTKKDVRRTLEYVVKDFKSKVYFYFFDDDEDDPQNKKIIDLLNQFNIKEERYEFFKPDFVTHNFNTDEIFDALCIYLKDDEGTPINQDDLTAIRERIRESYEKSAKIEDTVGKIFVDMQFGSFSKPKFGECLGDVVRKEIKKGKNRKVFPFEDVFYKRFYKITKAYLEKK